MQAALESVLKISIIEPINFCHFIDFSVKYIQTSIKNRIEIKSHTKIFKLVTE